MAPENQPEPASPPPPPPPPPEVVEEAIVWIERGDKRDIERRERAASPPTSDD
jgi:hypothetical protein